MKDAMDILSLNYDEISAYITQMGAPHFRAAQLFGWLHKSRVTAFADMTDVPKAMRETLARDCYIQTLHVRARQASKDGTVKYLFALNDGNCVETVALRYAHGLSVCVSSQVGCAMGCGFCASTQGGLVRNLAPSEMLAQVYTVAVEENNRVNSVVLMGIGEPLANTDNVLSFYEILTDARGYDLAARAVTLSTCGLVPAIYALADKRLQLTLSVSLHAATDDKRAALMPVNRKYPLEALIAACKYYFEKTGRRVTFEYAVMHGSNDGEEDADALAALLKGQNAHVNLIPVNSVRGVRFRATREHAIQFQDKLSRRHINATVRRTLGTDIDAACGQLRRNYIDKA